MSLLGRKSLLSGLRLTIAGAALCLAGAGVAGTIEFSSSGGFGGGSPGPSPGFTAEWIRDSIRTDLGLPAGATIPGDRLSGQCGYNVDIPLWADSSAHAHQTLNLFGPGSYQHAVSFTTDGTDIFLIDASIQQFPRPDSGPAAGLYDAIAQDGYIKVSDKGTLDDSAGVYGDGNKRPDLSDLFGSSLETEWDRADFDRYAAPRNLSRCRGLACSVGRVGVNIIEEGGKGLLVGPIGDMVPPDVAMGAETSLWGGLSYLAPRCGPALATWGAPVAYGAGLIGTGTYTWKFAKENEAEVKRMYHEEMNKRVPRYDQTLDEWMTHMFHTDSRVWFLD